MKHFVTIFLLLSLVEAKAQFVVASGTSGIVDAQMSFDFQKTGDIVIDPVGNVNDGPFLFTNAALTLSGNVNPNFTIQGLTPLTLGSITVNTTQSYILNGKLEVTKDLILSSGILSVGSTSKLVYSGTNNLSGSIGSYINGKLFVKGSSQSTFPFQRTFPIGNSLGYLPVTLEDVKSTDKDTEIGFEAIVGDPGISPTSPEIKDVFKNYYWVMTNGNSGVFSGAQIQLSLNYVDNFFIDGDPVVMEFDTDGNLHNLSGIKADPNVTSIAETTPKGQKYALAKSDAVAVNIHRVITPNGDGVNDFLIIDGIDFYSQNSVKLVDRWGVVHYTKENFKNFNVSNPADFDFGKLSNGNYICVVELTSGVKVTPKMISVIK